MQEIIISLLIGFGLSIATGFRIFVPLLIAGLFLRFHISLPFDLGLPTHSWLSSTPALIALSCAVVVEFLAYKIPYFDHLLDIAGAPLAAMGGLLLTTTFMNGVHDPFIKYSLAIIAGSIPALAVHSTSALTRLASTKTTAGIANPLLSFIEFISSAVTTVMALFLPILCFILVCFVVYFIWRIWFKKKTQTLPN